MKQPRPLRLVFFSRAYPPVVGGIEKQNYEIARALSSMADVTIIANTRGKLFLPWYLVSALWQSFRHVPGADVILLGDGVLAVLGVVLRRWFRKPVVCILHGLDVTYANSLYQKLWLGKWLPQMDKYIAVGNEAIRQGMARGLKAERFVFIPNGVEYYQAEKEYSRKDLEAWLGKDFAGKKILLTLGRLVKRKGVAWFVENVMPLLPEQTIYLVAGNGKELTVIEDAIKLQGLQSRVFCLGQVTEAQKNLLLDTADMFIQPNIPVKGDMEGFGLVVLEAAAHGRVVLASALEGLADAIHEGKNGFLLAAGDAEAYRATITQWLVDSDKLQQTGTQARLYVQDYFSWQQVGKWYLAELSARW